jgi:hypothetical protein
MKVIGIHAKARSGKDEFGSILKETYGFKPASFAMKIKGLAIQYFGQTPDEVFVNRTPNSRKILQGIGTMCREETDSIHGMLQAANNGFIDNDDLYEGVSKQPKWVEKLGIKYFYIIDSELKSRKRFVKDVLMGIREMFLKESDNFVEVCDGDQRKIWINYLISNLSDNGVYVITDVRHANEKIAIENLTLPRSRTTETAKRGVVIKLVRMDAPPIEAGQAHPTEIELDLEEDWFALIRNEHKADWREGLVQQASNLVRELDNKDFFDVEDRDLFKININES